MPMFIQSDQGHGTRPGHTGWLDSRYSRPFKSSNHALDHSAIPSVCRRIHILLLLFNFPKRLDMAYTYFGSLTWKIILKNGLDKPYKLHYSLTAKTILKNTYFCSIWSKIRRNFATPQKKRGSSSHCLFPRPAGDKANYCAFFAAKF